MARAPVNNGRHRELAKAIRIEADLYRKSLDTAQAARQFDAKPALPFPGRASRLGVPMKSKAMRILLCTMRGATLAWPLTIPIPRQFPVGRLATARV